ncbi:MAG: hypothetical protein K2Y09_06520 [Nitrosomonas sp.]|uniref:hypothetical protein n=1 Tax=Nitrosomonas sp. TaxID=42353 RepID=UPI001D9AF6FF|nr:hypothetical protein [Nitrosomonas sp.]MBX9894819.1 hypothetical protein [Nitrosomonas sp.]
MTADNNLEQNTTRAAHIGRYILIGFLTVAPLWVTLLVFDFLLNLLASVGAPLLKAMARAIHPFSDTTASWCWIRIFSTLLRHC